LVREVVCTVAAGDEGKEVESESVMVGGLVLLSRAAATGSLSFVVAEHVKLVWGAGVKVTDKGWGRREVGKAQIAVVALMGAAISRDRGNVEGAAIVLRGRDTEEQRGGDGKEKSIPTWLLCMFRKFNSGFPLYSYRGWNQLSQFSTHVIYPPQHPNHYHIITK
jgi:hypothetical protein